MYSVKKYLTTRGIVLFRLHPDAGVETNRLGIHVTVREQLDGQRRELAAIAESLGEQDSGTEACFELIGRFARAVDGRVDESGQDAVRAHANRRRYRVREAA